MIEAIVQILKEHEKAKDFDDSILEEIAKEAIDLRTFQDMDWLAQKLEEAKSKQLLKLQETLSIDSSKISRPTSVTSQEELDEILKRHEAWIASVLNPSVMDFPAGRANLEGADLRGLSLKGYNLSSANLKRANLAGSDCSYVNFSHARLQGANLKGAVLEGANFKNAYMEADQ